MAGPAERPQRLYRRHAGEPATLLEASVIIPGTGTTESMPTPEEILDRTREEGLAELTGFLRIPSISSQPEHPDDVPAAADHLADLYTHIGLEKAEAIDTAGHQVVYADWPHDPNKPTVLVSVNYYRPPA